MKPTNAHFISPPLIFGFESVCRILKSEYKFCLLVNLMNSASWLMMNWGFTVHMCISDSYPTQSESNLIHPPSWIIGKIPVDSANLSFRAARHKESRVKTLLFTWYVFCHAMQCNHKLMLMSLADYSSNTAVVGCSGPIGKLQNCHSNLWLPYPITRALSPLCDQHGLDKLVTWSWSG